jgi:hypothetical protein
MIDPSTLKTFIADLQRIRLNHIARANIHKEKSRKHNAAKLHHDTAAHDLWDIIDGLQTELDKITN